MDIQKLVNYFAKVVGEKQVKMIDVPGRTFPVKTYFLEEAVELLRYKVSDQMRQKARKKVEKPNPYMSCPHNYSQETKQTMSLMNENEINIHLIEKIIEWCLKQELKGGVLVFLPGWEAISQCIRQFKRNHTLNNGCFFLPMHSQVPKSEQGQVFDQVQRDGKRKVVLSTNIAETSITIPDISYVIDSCRCKFKHYKPIAESQGTFSTGAKSQPLMSIGSDLIIKLHCNGQVSCESSYMIHYHAI